MILLIVIASICCYTLMTFVGSALVNRYNVSYRKALNGDEKAAIIFATIVWPAIAVVALIFGIGCSVVFVFKNPYKIVSKSWNAIANANK